MPVTLKKRDAEDLIAEAVRSVELRDFPSAWNELDTLSSETTVDNIGVDPAGIRVSGTKFSGLASVYVALRYGKGDDEFTTSEAFRGKFHGHFDQGKPLIDDFTVDTSPFFA
ncbi:pPIWI-associating nuclease domain-containing protein [Ancylobacter defluvii]|uniref:Uncharacterized protein n=1 Tax=Ancylobacter defluvii TaxID=1282440 RepID=A0A9W6K0C7_9HYPH|nr:hypothetical protein [Ancylobacter defluvii]MBS7588195.1 hypothetical protein [Ancylobacter defluvii]GLK86587.1 hypothetical protein GCM10017653_46570 [Ancylobacter defluvii]